ncbi:spore coat U domain-containing protein [Massilia sp. G4R7]|uniref:Spore coat U domain-containing protein n=2 Tax=Massilia TaxID=149698 RepID=A0ABS8QBI9_9BURK|nr:spore coat U domain-containing protein [Massilia phyllostachyos]MCD2519128.1 spore coat U domain-containing protein [Massilia phyllostachyos]
MITKHLRPWRRLLLLALPLLALWLAPATARANTCSASMTDVVFDKVSPIAGSDYYATGTLTINCTYSPGSGLAGLLLPNVSVCATLGGNDYALRTMKNGGNALPFNLYTDASYAAAKIWGQGAATGTAAFNASLTALLSLGTATGSVTVYGRIPGNAIGAVPTSGGASTTYTASFAGLGILRYAFGTLVDTGCTNGSIATFSFQARASVVNDCYINANPLTFGATNVLSAAVRARTTINVQCTAGSPYQVTLNAGANGAGGVRRMKNPVTGEMVRYTLSATLDGGNWGDGTVGQPLGGTGTGAVQALGVFSRVDPQTTPTPGDYKDTVTATVSF